MAADKLANVLTVMVLTYSSQGGPASAQEGLILVSEWDPGKCSSHSCIMEIN